MRTMNSFAPCNAKCLSADSRHYLGLASIKAKQTITELSKDFNVSRKFIHKIKNKLLDMLSQAFEQGDALNKELLFNVPVTKTWVEQLILSIKMHCKGSRREIQSVIKDMLDYNISVGKIQNVITEAEQKAKIANTDEDLSNVRLGTNDELFQHNKPILSGVDINSLYCYLLSMENDRDGDTWAIHLMDLQEKGYNPDRVFADSGKGLRSGHKLALPNTPIATDHFHTLQKLMDVRRFYRNKLKTASTYMLSMEYKMQKSTDCGTYQDKYSKRLDEAIKAFEKEEHLSKSLDILVSWMQHDVLSLAGVNPKDREVLFDFVLEELNKLALISPHRIHDLCVTLANQKNLLLACTHVLNKKFSAISVDFEVSLQTIWNICYLQRYKKDGSNYAVKLVPFLDVLGEEFYDIEDAVISALETTERTSSMIENLNGRVRKHLSAHKKVGNDALGLIRFYFNHVPFKRSRVHRTMKTPTQMLTGKDHPHWLEMLGYVLFKHAA